MLVRRAEPAMEVARGRSEVSGETAHVYTDTCYAARTWGGARRVLKLGVRTLSARRAALFCICRARTVPGVKLSPPHRPHPPSCPPARPITPIFAGHMARSRPRVDHAPVGNRFRPLSGTPIDRFQTAMNNPV